MPARRCWLVKSEPDEYSIDDLARDGRTCWDGVRNYQARNTLRDDMKPGDQVLFYHSSTEPTGVVGAARVCKAGYPDHTAQDRKSDHYDPRATTESPIWYMVDIEFVERFSHIVTLPEMRKSAALQGMRLLQPGRLSVMPVDPEHFDVVLSMGRQAAARAGPRKR